MNENGQDMTDKIGSLLSDAESLKQIKELAELMQAEINGPESTAANNPNGSDSDMFGGLNIDMLMQIGDLLSAVGSTDKNSALLLALKPHLCDERREKVDKAVKMLKLYAVFTAMKEKGMLNGLDRLL